MMSSKIRLYVNGAQHKFVTLVRKNRSIESALHSVTKAYSACFGEDAVFERLEFDGYTLPNEYIVGELLEDRAKVTAVVMPTAEHRPTKRFKECEPEVAQELPSHEMHRPNRELHVAEPAKRKESHEPPEHPKRKDTHEVPELPRKKETHEAQTVKMEAPKATLKEVPRPKEQSKPVLKAVFNQEDSEESDSDTEGLALSHTPKRNLFRS